MKLSHFIVIFCTVMAVAAICFRNKIVTEPNEIDQFKEIILPVKAYIRPGTIIGFGGTYRQVEGLLWSRYLLFPQRIDRVQDFERDTLLILLDERDSDSVKHSFLSNRTILWSNIGQEKSFYLLTSKYD